MKKCLFLDRDGVINFDPGDYTFEIEKFQFLPGIFEVVRNFKREGFLVIVITNQGGIAKKRYTQTQMQTLHNYMLEQFEKNDAAITDVFYSLHHDKISASIDRKPDSLLIERALYLHSINPAESLMIGDKDSDVKAAQKAGVKGYKIERNSSLLAFANHYLNR